MKIVLAVDHSTYSEAALRALTAQIRPQDTEVAVLHVMEMSLADFESTEVFERTRRARLKDAQELVGKFVKELEKGGYATKSVVEGGNAKGAIVEFAEKWGADLIFLGSHGRRGWKRLTLGGVADAVAGHAHCSVQIVRSHGNA